MKRLLWVKHFLSLRFLSFYTIEPNNKPMEVKVRIVMMSHLSDAQELTGLIKPDVSHRVLSDRINHHINFAKWLLVKFPDTNTEIDADAEYELYQKFENERRANKREG